MYYGGTVEFESSLGWSVEGDQAGEWFGYAVADAGDINSDGYADLIIGAPHFSGRENDAGAVFGYAGSSRGPGGEPAWTVEGEAAGSGFGQALDRAGDVNGDGYSDVIVGAFRASHGETEEGRAWVFYGSPHGLSYHYSWSAEGDQAGAWFGYSVSRAGDINRDGYSDVLIGAPYYDGQYTDEGAAFVYLGSDTGLAAGPEVVLTIGVTGAVFGFEVASAGDINDDGRSDILVGAGGERSILDIIGYAFLYRGIVGGIHTEPAWTAWQGAGIRSLGRTVLGVGDIDGNGCSDVLIGDPFYGDVDPGAGRVLLFYGTRSGLSESPGWIRQSVAPDDGFGQALAPLGDIDGDGFFDLAVSAPGHTGSADRAGAVYVYRSNGLSRPLMLRNQVRADSSRIGLLGYSEDPDHFRLAVRAALPAGATRLRLQWQAHYQQFPLESSPLQTGGVWFVPRPLDPPGLTWLDIVATVNKPEAIELVRWRVRAATNLPAQPFTKWFYHPGNITNEPSVRFGMAPDIPAPPGDSLPPPPLEPPEYSLIFDPAFPNPFKSSSSIRFALPSPGLIDIVIYDVAGRRVKHILREVRREGPHLVTWHGDTDSGERAAAGIYLARFEYKNQIIMRKMVLIR
jgi:hypothetical protein